MPPASPLFFLDGAGFGAGAGAGFGAGAGVRTTGVEVVRVGVELVVLVDGGGCGAACTTGGALRAATDLRARCRR
jgi:hypothetical protein